MKSAPTRCEGSDTQVQERGFTMALAMPLAFSVFGFGLIGVLVIVALVVLIVRML
jgi:hypothetical protein